MSAKMVVFPHATGPWLVTVGCRYFTVPPSLGRALLPLHRRRPDATDLKVCLGTESPAAVDALARLLEEEPLPAGRSKPCAGPLIRWRLTLVPARLTARWAARLAPLAAWPVMAACTAAGILGYLWPRPAAPTGSEPATLILALVLFFLTGLWHELGHAAALDREGFPPGEIGVGVLLILPVLFADVTPVGGLPRSGRLRVDAAGMCFQTSAGGGLFAVGHLGLLPGIWSPAAVLAGAGALLAVVWSLIPFVRSDGYWLVCDLLDRKDLDGPAAPGAGRRRRWGLRAFQMTHVVFQILVGLLLPWRAGVIAAWLTARLGAPAVAGPVGWTVVGLGLVLAGGVMIRAWPRTRGLWRAAWRGR